jgi:hypothetical protein
LPAWLRLTVLNKEKNGYAGVASASDETHSVTRVHRYPEAGGGLFSTTHDILRYGLMLANDGELDGKRFLSRAAMDELRKNKPARPRSTTVLAIISATACLATMVPMAPTCQSIQRQEWSPSSWCNAPVATSGPARDLFLKTAAQVYPK